MTFYGTIRELNLQSKKNWQIEIQKIIVTAYVYYLE